MRNNVQNITKCRRFLFIIFSIATSITILFPRIPIHKIIIKKLPQSTVLLARYQNCACDEITCLDWSRVICKRSIHYFKMISQEARKIMAPQLLIQKSFSISWKILSIVTLNHGNKMLLLQKKKFIRQTRLNNYKLCRFCKIIFWVWSNCLLFVGVHSYKTNQLKNWRNLGFAKLINTCFVADLV